MSDDLELSPATATGGGIIAADELTFGTATGRLVQRVKLGFGTDGAYTETATGSPYPVRIESTRFAVDSAAGGSDTGLVLLAVRDDTPGEITATDGDYAQLRTATDGSLRVTQNGTLDIAAATGSISVIQSTAADLNMTAATTGVFDVQQMSSATSPVSVGTYTATGIVNIVNASTATIPVSIGSTVNIAAATGSIEVIQATAANLNVTVSTANTFDVSAATTATQAVAVQNTATVAVSGTVNIAAATGSISVIQGTAANLNVTVATTATQAVSVQNTATVAISGAVEVFQATATALHAVMHPLGLRDTSNWVYNSVTATGVATFATGAGTNNFNDLVAIYLSNSATTQQTARIRSSSTATVFTMTLAPDGGGFIWQPIKPLPQAVANTGWDIQIENAIATPGITVTALFEQTT